MRRRDGGVDVDGDEGGVGGEEESPERGEGEIGGDGEEEESDLRRSRRRRRGEGGGEERGTAEEMVVEIGRVGNGD